MGQAAHHPLSRRLRNPSVRPWSVSFAKPPGRTDRHYSGMPVFAFGHGVSYTAFTLACAADPVPAPMAASGRTHIARTTSPGPVGGVGSTRTRPSADVPEAVPQWHVEVFDGASHSQGCQHQQERGRHRCKYCGCPAHGPTGRHGSSHLSIAGAGRRFRRGIQEAAPEVPAPRPPQGRWKGAGE